MTVRELVGCVGLLGTLFAVVIAGQGCADALRKAENAADKVAAVVQNARDAAGKTCDKAVPSCAVYFDAVRAGLVPDDDRAELACSKVSTVCALLDAGAAGAAQ